MTAKCSACHSGFFFFFPLFFQAGPWTTSQKSAGPQRPFLTTLQTCFCFDVFFYCLFDDTVRFSDQGQHGRGQWRWTKRCALAPSHAKKRTRAHTHTQTQTLWCLLKHLCFWKKTKQLSFFIRQPWGDTPLFFLPSEFQWVSQKGWASWSAI